MEFHEFRGFGRFLGIMLSKHKGACAAPTRKNVGSSNPSKEQGARLDLTSLGWFSWIPSNFIDFMNFMNFVIWEVSGGSAAPAKRGSAAPTRKNVGASN